MELEITFLMLYYNTALHIYTQMENKTTKKCTKATKLSLTSYIGNSAKGLLSNNGSIHCKKKRKLIYTKELSEGHKVERSQIELTWIFHHFFYLQPFCSALKNLSSQQILSGHAQNQFSIQILFPSYFFLSNTGYLSRLLRLTLNKKKSLISRKETFQTNRNRL